MWVRNESLTRAMLDFLAHDGQVTVKDIGTFCLVGGRSMRVRDGSGVRETITDPYTIRFVPGGRLAGFIRERQANLEKEVEQANQAIKAKKQ